MKVKLTVKATAKELSKLNALNSSECDVDWTWGRYFESACGVEVDPRKYLVKSGGGKSHVRVDQQVRDLIGQFKKVRQFYRVDVVACRVAGGVPVNVVNSIGKKRPAPVPVSPKKVPMSRGRDTKNQPKKGNFPPPVETPGGKSSKGTKRPANYPVPGSPPMRKARTETEEKAAHLRSRVDYEPRVNDIDGDGVEDDNMSQLTADSQDSQDDFAAGSITDVKPDIMYRFIHNVSNIELNRIKAELQEIMNKGKWIKCSSRFPRAANFLMELFRVS